MVPTLAPSGDEPPPVARAAYPGTYHHSGASPYYASTLSAAAAQAGQNGHDPREQYSMAPPPHHTAYASHWGAAAAVNAYGQRQPQQITAQGLSHHLAPGAAMRLQQQQHQQHLSGVGRVPGGGGVGPDGLPLPHNINNQQPGQH